MIKCGEFSVVNTEERHHFDGIQSISGERCSAEGHLFTAQAQDALLPIYYLECMNGDRDIRVTGEIQGSKAIRRLEHGLRMTICPTAGREDMHWVQLSQARIKNPNTMWSNLYKGTRKQLQAGAGFDVLEFLKASGAIELGKKKDVLTSRDKGNYFVMLFEREKIILPILAYVCTRVLPLYNKYSGDQLKLF